MAKTRTATLALLLVLGVAGVALPHHAHAASCEAILGQWTWFVGGEVTIKSDGTFTQQSGNSGTWECTDPARGGVTLRWRQGGFVNQLALSADGRGLSSTDPSQSFVTAERIGAPSSTTLPTSPASGAAPNTTPSPPPSAPRTTGDTKAHIDKATQASKQPSRTVTPEDSQEIARLVERINQHYKGGQYFYWPSDSVYDDGYIRKGVSVTLDEGLTLLKHYAQCTMPNPNWIGADDPRANYRMSAGSIADCDKRHLGLKWEEKTERAPLAHIKSSSIQLPKTDTHDDGLDLTIGYEGYDPDRPGNLTFDEKAIYETMRIKGPPGFVSIECKDRSACEQMAADLKRLVEIARKSAAPGQTPSR